MGIGLAFYGFAHGFKTSAHLCIVKRIAVDRSCCIPIGAGCRAVYLANAFGGEMISGNTGGDDARSVLADASRGEVCRVTVHALRAAMVILVNAGIVQKAFIAGTRTDKAFPGLAKFIVSALSVTLSAMHRIALELLFWQTHRLCIGTAVYHAVITCIGALALRAATCFGGFSIRTNSTACAAVIGVAGMDIDTDVLVISSAE